MKVTRPLASYFTYTLGKSLYVPLTSRSNTKTLPETRGPNFLLSSEVVAALCRVRDEEHGTQQWLHWCMYLDSQEIPQKVPTPSDPLRSLPPSDGDRKPLISDLLEEIKKATLRSKSGFESIVLAGEGEPTLRLGDMLNLVQHLKSAEYSSTIRLTTNGLIENPKGVVQRLRTVGVDAVSVALMTADKDQYRQLMDPQCDADGHEMVCSFIEEATAGGLAVEVTGVDRSDVDKEAAESLSRLLSVEKPIRWRPYFP